MLLTYFTSVSGVLRGEGWIRHRSKDAASIQVTMNWSKHLSCDSCIFLLSQHSTVFFQLYRPGSVAYVSKSGGMSNELNNIIARNSDGVYEGVAIGGDRYPGTRFIDHLLRYQDNPAVSVRDKCRGVLNINGSCET